MKRIHWMGSSRLDLRSFPTEARGEIGFQLRMVQAGEEPLDWKPLSALGPGVMEIRVHRGGEFRATYVASFREALYVLHCFRKKSQQTGRADIEMVRRRLAAVHGLRRREGFDR